MLGAVSSLNIQGSSEGLAGLNPLRAEEGLWAREKLAGLEEPEACKMHWLSS